MIHGRIFAKETTQMDNNINKNSHERVHNLFTTFENEIKDE